MPRRLSGPLPGFLSLTGAGGAKRDPTVDKVASLFPFSVDQSDNGAPVEVARSKLAACS